VTHSSLLLALLSALSASPAHTELERAMTAAAAGDGAAANATLARLTDDPATRRELGLDLVEAWWRLAHQERAINTLSKWRQEAPRSPDPTIRARARALTGSPFDVEAALKTCTEPAALCQLLPVAQALDAVGRRGDGQRLLDGALSAGTCDDAATQRATWERPRERGTSPGSSAPVAAGSSRRFALGPGHEPRFVRVMPEQPGELSGGAGLVHLRAPEDRVEALYGDLDRPTETCAEAPLCVTLRHPSVARSGDRLVGAFAVRVEGVGGLASEALLDGISARLAEEQGWDPWQEILEAPPQPALEPVPDAAAPWPTWPPWVAVALLLGGGGLWAWRRRSRAAGL